VKKVHELKCWPEYFEDVASGRKPFEVRKKDRDFREGDEIRLREFLPNIKQYSGSDTWLEITKLWESVAGLEPGYCIMAVKVIPGVPF
jgi:ParB family chromosome partitioning protein